MTAAEGDNVRRYIYRGEGEYIRHDDHLIVIVHEDVTFILASEFVGHNIIEVICHEGVEKIEEAAFFKCPYLRRVVMPGVKVIEQLTFAKCKDLIDVECGKLEIIKEAAFNKCTSLRSINLPSVEIVEKEVFTLCTALTDVKFGGKLRRIEERAFVNCYSLERITIPLKDGLITGDDLFMGCYNLERVDLVEGDLHETIDALLLDDWRNDMNELIESINQILPNRYAGYDEFDSGYDYYEIDYASVVDEGEKALAIRDWIRSVLRKIIHYQAEHQRYVGEVGATLHYTLPREIVMNNILPFLELPSHTFEVEDIGDEESESDSEDEVGE